MAEGTVLFVDLCGSTRLFEALGDSRANALVEEAQHLWIEIVETCRGRTIKNTGDGLLCLFGEASDAVDAAKRMQRTLDTLSARHGQRMAARVSLQSGPLIERDGDVFGDTVNVSARLESIAKPRQILMGRETLEQLSAELAVGAAPLPPTRVKGRNALVEPIELPWEGAKRTRVARRPEDTNASSELALRASEHTLVLGPDHPSATLGRESFNDLVVEDDNVSRLHARIEMRDGQFVLRDESTNGTTLFVPGQPPRTIHHGEATLQSEGIMGLGTAPRPGGPGTVEYSVRSVDAGEETG